MTGTGAALLNGEENIGIDESSQVKSTFETGLCLVFFGAVAILGALLAKESQVGGAFFCSDSAVSGGPWLELGDDV